MHDWEHNFDMNERNGSSRRWQVVALADHPDRKSESEILCAPRSMIKPTLILTALLFLLIAPTPDSRDIAEMTANFLVAKNTPGLLASATPVQAAKEKDKGETGK
ncbi:MAG TPA: hypothetical protein VIS57_00825 [Xanthomonadales bacterium]